MTIYLGFDSVMNKTDIKSLIKLADELLAKPYNVDRIIREIELRIDWFTSDEDEWILDSLELAKAHWYCGVLDNEASYMISEINKQIQLIVREAIEPKEPDSILLEHIAKVTGQSKNWLSKH